MKQRVPALMVVLILAVVLHSSAFAADQGEPKVTKPSAAAIVADLLVLRPIGFAVTLAGCAASVASLPVALPLKKADQVNESLAVRPAYLTFIRPLGQMSLQEKYPEPDLKK